MEYCPHCMKETEGGERCPHCGGDLSYQAAEHLLPAGTVLKGSRNSYRLGAVLGRGGFGVTYIALEVETGRRAAVKEYFPARYARRDTDRLTVLPGLSGEAVYQGGLKSFLTEAEMLSKVNKLPCVVHVWDFFQANGTAYLAMEYLDGIPLYKVVAERGPVPAGDLLLRIQPLLSDLQTLHSAGIIHRDIAPDNIMWMADGSFKLLDFGCARSMEDGRSMTVLLKHGFAPVEQYQTRGQGPWTDVYALAATIYYCLTAAALPTDKNREGKTLLPSAVDRLEEDELVPPRGLGIDLTAAQEKALLEALAVQPKKRLQDVDGFARRLYGREEPTEPEPEPRPGPVPGPEPEARPGPDRRRLLLSLGAVALGIILAGLLLASLR